MAIVITNLASKSKYRLNIVTLNVYVFKSPKLVF